MISTLNVQHLESLNDVVEQITGVEQRETIPDEIVRRADEIELVDMTPRRSAGGPRQHLRAERVDTALANYFRPGNLAALRELALALGRRPSGRNARKSTRHHGIAEPWETRERILVALTGSANGEPLVRRASRIAQRTG